MAEKTTTAKNPGRPKKAAPAAQGKKVTAAAKTVESRPVPDMAEELVEKEIAGGKEMKDVSEIQFDPKAIEEAIKSVDTTIKSDGGLEDMMKTITEELKPIQEISNEVSKMNAKANTLSAAMEQNPEKAMEYAQKELDKVQKLKETVEKMLADTKVTPNKNMPTPTGWWNGMGVF